jgi:hypothetical protein
MTWWFQRVRFFKPIWDDVPGLRFFLESTSHVVPSAIRKSWQPAWRFQVPYFCLLKLDGFHIFSSVSLASGYRPCSTEILLENEHHPFF